MNRQSTSQVKYSTVRRKMQYIKALWVSYCKNPQHLKNILFALSFCEWRWRLWDFMLVWIMNCLHCAKHTFLNGLFFLYVEEMYLVLKYWAWARGWDVLFHRASKWRGVRGEVQKEEWWGTRSNRRGKTIEHRRWKEAAIKDKIWLSSKEPTDTQFLFIPAGGS